MAFNTYSRSAGYPIQNGAAPPTDIVTDHRSMYKDSVSGKYRFFISRAEVLSYFDTSAKRTEGVLFLVKEGATLVNDFTASGGTLVVYWFKDGKADVNCVLAFADSVDLSDYYSKSQVDALIKKPIPFSIPPDDPQNPITFTLPSNITGEVSILDFHEMHLGRTSLYYQDVTLTNRIIKLVDSSDGSPNKNFEGYYFPADKSFIPITKTSQEKILVPKSSYDALFSLSTEIIQGAKRTSSDGQNVDIILPDGNQYYNWTYTRDFSMALAARRDLFSADYINNWLEWVGEKVNTTNWQVPDHVAVNGEAFFQAQNGSRSVLDNQTWFINLVWESFKKSNSTAWFSANRNLLDHILTDGLPIINGIITIPLFNYGDAAYQQWGFNDSEVSTGVCTMINIFYFHALNQMAEMAIAAGDAIANTYLQKAKLVQNYLNTNLFDSTKGLYKTSTGKNSGQYDIWASAYATSWGIATPSIATSISNWFVTNINKICYRGNFRQVATDNEYNAGVAIWEAYLSNQGGVMTQNPLLTVGSTNEYNRYQNGGYWTTISEHAQITISITNPVLARQIFIDAAQSMIETNGVEWLNNTGQMNVEKYTASMAPLAYVIPDSETIIPQAALPAKNTFKNV